MFGYTNRYNHPTAIGRLSGPFRQRTDDLIAIGQTPSRKKRLKAKCNACKTRAEAKGIHNLHLVTKKIASLIKKYRRSKKKCGVKAPPQNVKLPRKGNKTWTY